MPTTATGRELINDYLDKNHITIISLATTYGVGKMYMSQVLSGVKQNPAANAMILKIIDDLKIRGSD